MSHVLEPRDSALADAGRNVLLAALAIAGVVAATDISTPMNVNRSPPGRSFPGLSLLGPEPFHPHSTDWGGLELAAALDDPATAFVLLSRTGRQLAPGAIAKQLKRRANTAGLYVLDSAHGEKRSLVSPHAIRRSIATELLNDGVPLDAVADLLAHEHVDTTRRHYAFANDVRRRATIDAILRHDAA